MLIISWTINCVHKPSSTRKWLLLMMKKSLWEESTISANMSTKIKPLSNITSSIKTILKHTSKEYPKSWNSFTIGKRNINTKKLNAFWKKNKIFPLPHKKALLFFQTFRRNKRSHIIPMFLLTWHKIVKFSMKKITNP